MNTAGARADPTASRLHDYARATVNILEDFDADRAHMLDTQRAILNMLDDSESEQRRLDETHSAVVNILADFADERGTLDDVRRAMLNLLADFDAERSNAEAANRDLGDAIASLRAAKSETDTANRELEAFSYSVSHDLRGPLRSMDGFSQALLEDYGDALDATAQDYLRRVRAGSQRMSKLIDDLLGLSRVSRGNMKREKVNLSTIAESIADELRETAPGRDVTFCIAPNVMVEGDPRLLEVVLRNLLGNSWKFTSKHQSAVITLDATGDDGARTYFVRDDGAGFDMAYADALFEPFRRLHAVREFDGTGIGLATIQRIVHRHGGRIWAEGAVEKGATIYFTLSPDVEGGSS